MIIPYVFTDNHWSIPYETMRAIYYQMVDERTAESVFSLGSVFNFEGFLKLMQSPNNCVIIQWEDKQPVFLGWINNFSTISVMAHFCCFKTIWGKKTKEVCDNALKYWFDLKREDGTPLFDTIVGLVSDDNQRAIEMIQKCGLIKMGTIPGYSTNHYTKKKVGATILYIERS